MTSREYKQRLLDIAGNKNEPVQVRNAALETLNELEQEKTARLFHVGTCVVLVALIHGLFG